LARPFPNIQNTFFSFALCFTSHQQCTGATSNKSESTKYGHSLSKERRKRELQRISNQNLKILRRIQESKPTYNHCHWEEEAKANDRIIANISEFRKPSERGELGTRTRSYFDEDVLMHFEDC